MTRARASLLLSALALLPLPLGGCRRGVPPLEMLRLHPVALDSMRVASRPVVNGDIVVRPYVADGVLSTRAVTYQLADGRYGEYPTREWAARPGDMLAERTGERLRARGFTTGRVHVAPGDRRDAPWLWEGRVAELTERATRSELSGVVEVEARLVRLADGRVLWSGTARRTVPARGETMDAVVRAISEAAAAALDALIGEASGALGRRTATPADPAGAPPR